MTANPFVWGDIHYVFANGNDMTFGGSYRPDTRTYNVNAGGGITCPWVLGGELWRFQRAAVIEMVFIPTEGHDSRCPGTIEMYKDHDGLWTLSMGSLLAKWALVDWRAIA